jgi:hypothetical protein
MLAPSLMALADAQKKELVVCAGAMLFVAGILAAGFHAVRLDDAYVTFRYSQNLAAGRGFVFNTGERLLGTSAPGEALLGALVALAFGPETLLDVMSAIGAIAWTAQAATAYALLRRPLGVPGAAIVAAALAGGLARSYLYVPLETNVVAALVLGALACAVKARYRWAAALAGLAAVFRGDAILAAVPLGVLCLRDIGRATWKPAAIGAAFVALWTTFATLYFGSPMPRTFAMKQGEVTFATFARHVVQQPAAVIAPFGPPDRQTVPWAVALGVWALAIGGWAVLLRRDRRLSVVPVWVALHAAAYLMIRPDPGFAWHVYPVVLIVAIGASAGIVVLAERAGARGAGGARTLLLAVCGILLVVPAAWKALEFSVIHEFMFWYGSRDTIDRLVASYLRERSLPGDRVDAEEVGTLAYWSDLPMMDHPGLVTPSERFVDKASSYPELRRKIAFAHLRIVHDDPRVRWLVLNKHEVLWHRPLYGDRQLVAFDVGLWRLWVADLRAPPN